MLCRRRSPFAPARTPPRLSGVSADAATRVGVTEQAIPVAELLEWVTTPDCGGIDVFCGTVRDHAEGRTGIVRLDYEAHPTETVPRLARVADRARELWPVIGRIALIHRIGSLRVGDIAVVVATSTPHRPEAFAATRWCIDALKATVPIWKYEVWDGGEGWGTCAHELIDLDEFDPDVAGATAHQPLLAGEH